MESPKEVIVANNEVRTDTAGNRKVVVDTPSISVRFYIDTLQELGSLDDAQKVIVRNVIRRNVELAVLSVGAGEEQLAEFRIERNALMSTLANIGEAKGAAAQAVIEGAIWDLVDRVLNVGLGKS